MRRRCKKTGANNLFRQAFRLEKKPARRSAGASQPAHQLGYFPAVASGTVDKETQKQCQGQAVFFAVDFL